MLWSRGPLSEINPQDSSRRTAFSVSEVYCIHPGGQGNNLGSIFEQPGLENEKTRPRPLGHKIKPRSQYLGLRLGNGWGSGKVRCHRHLSNWICPIGVKFVTQSSFQTLP